MTNLQGVPSLVEELAKRITYPRLAEELGVSDGDLHKWEQGEAISAETERQLVRVSNKYGFFDLLPLHGVPPAPYDLNSPVNLLKPPLGSGVAVPSVSLRESPTTIAGLSVDFPLALPASILAANSSWIEFYARRGFDILTYKTVRTRYWDAHAWPNWVFVRDPAQLEPPFQTTEVTAEPRYWPDDISTASMVNSFGVPSLGPDWWQEDIQRARNVIRDGHQVLIVSVLSSVNGSRDEIADDFVRAALMAKDAGAQIIEANFSCPNVPDHSVGELFEAPEDAAYVSAALRKALKETPLFVKIGYLPHAKLSAFVQATAGLINGVTAINTVSVRTKDGYGHDTFPGRPRAGASGWAISSAAREVARNLVALRAQFDREMQILAVGGVMTAENYGEYISLGVDAVGACTGAFLDPDLGLKIRALDDALKHRKPHPVLRNVLRYLAALDR